MLVQQISVFLENKAGRLADVTQVLGKNGVNICALSIADTTEFGILRLIVEEPQKVEALLRENGFTVSCTNVIAIGLVHEPGRLGQVLSILNERSIGVEYVYAYVGKYRSEAVVIVKTDQPEMAAQVLKENGVDVLPEQELYQI